MTVPRRAVAVVAVLACILAGSAFRGDAEIDEAWVATVARGSLTAQLTTSGVLKPIRSMTYNSPLAGRDAEVLHLVPEGTRVAVGDLLASLDTTELEREAERARQDVRQSLLDVQMADIDRQEAEAAVTGVAQGEGALNVEEARSRVQLGMRRVERLREEYEQLTPLLDKGFLTRDELRKTGDALEQAEEELALARKRADVVIGITHPREGRRAELQLAQKTSQLQNARAKAAEAGARLEALLRQIEACRILARRPGLAVYEDLLTASPRRKIRVGDRVSASQGLVTIPEVDRMLVEATVGEAEVHRVRVGQDAMVRVEAFPDLRLRGVVTRIGVLARSSSDRPQEDKRFDVIVELEQPTGELRPEMTARADIVVGTRANVLLAPVNAIFDEQGRTVAHVVRRSGVETQIVEAGESNGSQVEIRAGLREGERLMLVDAASAQPRSSDGGGTGHALQPR